MLRASDGGSVTVDLRGVVRIGSAAADVLTTALRQSAAHGITMTIVGGGPGADEPLDAPVVRALPGHLERLTRQGVG